MPCYRCGARQTDPVRGPSPWKRAVRGDAQVLVCPDCQRRHDWAADMDRCASCGSMMLVRLLGETQCRTCGAVGTAVRSAPGAPPPDALRTGPARTGPAAQARPDGLSDDVQAALDRMFGRA